MFNHATYKYQYPICLGVKGIENEHTLLRKEDLVYKDALVSVFINSFWIKSVEGHVIVVPNDHYENIYDLPDTVGAQLFSIIKKMAVALKKAYKCDGITTRQNNEPAGNQHAFHYHHHVFPRYTKDTFDKNSNQESLLLDPQQRKEYVKKLQAASGNY